MSYPKHMYLTDEQYLALIEECKKIAAKSDFNPVGDDCTIPGMKSTESNCGLCNEDLTTLETALFPKDFPRRKSMKYRRDYHKCPLDMRAKPGLTGCFYTCVLFNRRYRGYTREQIRELILAFDPKAVLLGEIK